MELKQNYEVDKDAHYKPKKYVFKIYPENIDHIEPLDIKKREEFINEAIQSHINGFSQAQKQIDFIEQLKKFALYAIIIMLLLPFIAYFVKAFSVKSDATTKQMKYNFERLFENYNIK